MDQRGADERQHPRALCRLQAILKDLQRGFTVPEVAKRQRVGPRTIRRDIALLRDRLGYEVNWNFATERWEITTPAERIL